MWKKKKSKETPKVTPNDHQRRPSGPPKATNGAQRRPRGTPMEPQSWQMEPQWPSKGTQGSPRVPKDHRRQAKRAQWNLNSKNCDSQPTLSNKQQTTNNKSLNPQSLHIGPIHVHLQCVFYTIQNPRLNRPSSCQRHMCAYVHPNIYFCFSIYMYVCSILSNTMNKNRDSGPL